MPRLAIRIERLEREGSGARICHECGAGDPAAKRLFTVFVEGDANDTPDLCPACGRRQVFHIDFDE